ncbi:hypothetical protein KSP39_PZI004255 [Platanthera zijinensis]|uniref:MICOS complex subunit MIC10 n=1 Tax=Platanthera zijinensis TaxID=2320716 RepID=A0AAP0GCQ4_9ASPA
MPVSFAVVWRVQQNTLSAPKLNPNPAIHAVPENWSFQHKHYKGVFLEFLIPVLPATLLHRHNPSTPLTTRVYAESSPMQTQAWDNNYHPLESLTFSTKRIPYSCIKEDFTCPRRKIVTLDDLLGAIENLTGWKAPQQLFLHRTSLGSRIGPRELHQWLALLLLLLPPSSPFFSLGPNHPRRTRLRHTPVSLAVCPTRACDTPVSQAVFHTQRHSTPPGIHPSRTWPGTRPCPRPCCLSTIIDRALSRTRLDTHRKGHALGHARVPGRVHWTRPGTRPWSPITRWASVAFGAGVGIGTAYTECSYIFDGSVPKWTSPKISSVSYGSSQTTGVGEKRKKNKISGGIFTRRKGARSGELQGREGPVLGADTLRVEGDGAATGEEMLRAGEGLRLERRAGERATGGSGA